MIPLEINTILEEKQEDKMTRLKMKRLAVGEMKKAESSQQLAVGFSQLDKECLLFILYAAKAGLIRFIWSVS